MKDRIEECCGCNKAIDANDMPWCDDCKKILRSYHSEVKDESNGCVVEYFVQDGVSRPYIRYADHRGIVNQMTEHIESADSAADKMLQQVFKYLNSIEDQNARVAKAMQLFGKAYHHNSEPAPYPKAKDKE